MKLPITNQSTLPVTRISNAPDPLLFWSTAGGWAGDAFGNAGLLAGEAFATTAGLGGLVFCSWRSRHQTSKHTSSSKSSSLPKTWDVSPMTSLRYFFSKGCFLVSLTRLSTSTSSNFASLSLTMVSWSAGFASRRWVS